MFPGSRSISLSLPSDPTSDGEASPAASGGGDDELRREVEDGPDSRLPVASRPQRAPGSVSRLPLAPSELLAPSPDYTCPVPVGPSPRPRCSGRPASSPSSSEASQASASQTTSSGFTAPSRLHRLWSSPKSLQKAGITPSCLPSSQAPGSVSRSSSRLEAESGSVSHAWSLPGSSFRSHLPRRPSAPASKLSLSLSMAAPSSPQQAMSSPELPFSPKLPRVKPKLVDGLLKALPGSSRSPSPSYHLFSPLSLSLL